MKLKDDFYWSKYEKVITHDRHQVPALGYFAHINYPQSFSTKPRHYHANIMELFCMVSGIRNTRIEKGSHAYDYSISGNQIMVLYPFEVHSTIDDMQTPCDYYSFQIDLSNPDNMLGLNARYSNILYNILTGLKYHSYYCGNTAIKEIVTSFNLFSIFSEESIASGVQMLNSFLFSLQLLPHVEYQEEVRIDSQIQLSAQYIQNHLDSKIVLSQLAEIAGYSLPYYKVLFKRNYGISPGEYIAIQKVERAKNLLRDTNTDITSIAFSLGFSSSSYFCNIFKKYTNMTPKQYRNREKEDWARMIEKDTNGLII